jgi:hypothetical protein
MHSVEIHAVSRGIVFRYAHVYPIGSRKRSIGRLVTLLTVLVAALAVLYWALARFTEWPLLLFVLIVILTVLHRAFDRNAGGMWAVFVMKDTAYGWVSQAGIEYKTPFSKGHVQWSDVYQLDYSPYTGRIVVYLRGKGLPLQFGPYEAVTDSHGNSLSDLLRETCGGTFVEQR